MHVRFFLLVSGSAASKQTNRERDKAYTHEAIHLLYKQNTPAVKKTKVRLLSKSVVGSA